MAHTKEDLYVSIDPKVYRKNKALGLNSQADILKMMKYIQNLKVLSRQRHDLRDRLYKLFDSIKKEVEVIENKFPNPVIPGKIKKSLPKKSEQMKMKVRRDLSKRDSIDEELQDIKERLARLNA